MVLMHRTARRALSGLATGLLVGAVAACSDGGTSAPVNAGPSEASTLPSPITGTGVTTAPASPTTTAPATTTAPPPSAAAPTASTGEYAVTAPPALPEHSAVPPPADSFPDGIYYGVVKASAVDPSPNVTLTIYEMFSGPAAIAAATADGVGLDSDFYVRSTSSADRPIDLGPTVAISVAQPDDPAKSFSVSGAELVRLQRGAPPSAGAPPSYRYVPFPFLVTVTGGTPTRVEQLWSP
jgi:hypothetical protein